MVGRRRVSLDLAELAAEADGEEILAVADAISRLEQQDPDVAQVVRLRFYVGLSVEEAAEALGVSERTVDRDWTFARAADPRAWGREKRVGIEAIGAATCADAMPTTRRSATCSWRRWKSRRRRRGRFIHEAADGNPGLAEEVESLLAALERRDDFLVKPTSRGRLPPLSTPSKAPARCIGPYKLLEQIGEGGYGRRLHGRAGSTRSAARSR